MSDFITIKLPDGGSAKFPATMPPEEIEAVLREHFPPQQNPDGTYGQPPEGMVLDPRTNQYVDVSAMAQASPGRATMHGAGQGLSFGALDEVVAGMHGATQAAQGKGGFQENYDFAKARMDAEEAANREEHPYITGGADIAGNIASMASIGRAAGVSLPWLTKGSTMARFGKGLGAGAIAGGLDGALQGYLRGDTGNRAENAGRSAMIGTAAGGALGALAPLAASAGKAATKKVLSMAQGAPKVKGLSRPAQEQLMFRGAWDADQIPDLSPDSMVADAGEGLMGLLDQSVNMSPAGASVAKSRVEQRAANAADNLKVTFDSTMGAPVGIRHTKRAIKKAQKPAINEAYKKAYAKPVDYSKPEGRKIEALFERMPPRIVKKALRRAEDRMRADEMPHQIMAKVTKEGVTFEKMPSVVQLDYIKRAFGDIARDSFDIETRSFKGDGGLAKRFEVEMRNAVGAAVPEYLEALSLASDEFSLQDAVDLGRDALRNSRATTPEVIADWAKNAGDAEKKAFAAGLRSEIEDRMASVSAAVSDGNMDAAEARKILRDMSSRASLAKIRVALGDKAADALEKSIIDGNRALGLKARVARNSQTAPRQQGDEMLRARLAYQPAQIARESASGGVMSGPRKILESLAGNTPLDQAQRREEIMREIAEYLTGPRGVDAQKALEDLRKASAKQLRHDDAGEMVGRGLAASLGLGGYQAAAQTRN